MKFTYTVDWDSNSKSFSVSEMYVLFKSNEFKSLQRKATKISKQSLLTFTPGSNIKFNSEVEGLWEDPTKINKYFTENNINVGVSKSGNILVTDIEVINNQNIDNHPEILFKIAPISLLTNYINAHHAQEKMVDMSVDYCIVTDEVMNILKQNKNSSQVQRANFKTMFSLNKTRAKQQLQYDSYKNLEYALNNNYQIINYKPFIDEIHKSYPVMDDAAKENMKNMFNSDDENDQILASKIIANINRTDKTSLENLTEVFFFHGSKSNHETQELKELEYYMRRFVFTRRKEQGY